MHIHRSDDEAWHVLEGFAVAAYVMFSVATLAAEAVRLPFHALP